MVLRYQVIVLAITFRNRFSKFIISIALFKGKYSVSKIHLNPPVTMVTDLSKVVILMLLIHCMFLLTLIVCCLVFVPPGELLASNINGKCFQIILNMYKEIKSCVSYNGEQSLFLSSFRGIDKVKMYPLYYLPYF